MIEVVHTAECVAAVEREKAWFAKWPNACGKCAGAGGKSYGGTYLQPPDFDLCSCLIEREQCPRCAEGIILLSAGDGHSEKYHCLACGWDELSQNSEMTAPIAECYCWAD